MLVRIFTYVFFLAFYGCSEQAESLLSLSIVNVLSVPVTIEVEGEVLTINPFQNIIYVVVKNDIGNDKVSIRYGELKIDIEDSKIGDDIIIGDKIQTCEYGCQFNDDYMVIMYDLINSNKVNTYDCDFTAISGNLEIYLNYLSEDGRFDDYDKDLNRYLAIPNLAKPIISGIYKGDSEDDKKSCLESVMHLLRYNDRSESNRKNHEVYAIGINNLKNGLPPEGVSVSTYNIGAIVDYYLNELNNYPLFEIFLFRLLNEEIRAERKYTGKKEYMITIKDVLTGEYKIVGQKLFDEYYSASSSIFDESARYKSIIQETEVENCFGLISKIPLVGNTNILFKFGFAGCKPCLDEEKYEVRLLEKYSNLEIASIYYSTSPTSFKEKCKSDFNHLTNYLLHVKDEKVFLKKLNKRIGAPFYSIYNCKTQMFDCIDCPRPSSTEIYLYLD